MGNPFEKNQTSKSETQPFTGVWNDRVDNLYGQMNSKYGQTPNNQYTGALVSDYGRNYLGGSADALANNLTNNTAMNGMATGAFLDPMSNPYMQNYMNTGVSKIQDQAAKGYDKINSLFQTRGLPFSSMHLGNLNNQNADTQNQIGQFINNAGMQGYQQNMGNMLNANNQINSGLNQLGNFGSTMQKFGQTDIQTALDAWKSGKTLDSAQTNALNSSLLSLFSLAKNPTTTQTSTESGGWGGSVLGAAASIFCFPAGTLISTPDGDVAIETLKVGDEVLSILGTVEIEKTIMSLSDTVHIVTDKGSVSATPSEHFLTQRGSVPLCNLQLSDILIRNDGFAEIQSMSLESRQTVYEIVCPWFFANGFAIDGFDPGVN